MSSLLAKQSMHDADMRDYAQRDRGAGDVQEGLGWRICDTPPNTNGSMMFLSVLCWVLYRTGEAHFVPKENGAMQSC